jgi:uncharacterized membrane protein YfcA
MGLVGLVGLGLLGLAAGSLSGLVGIGGGILIVPGLVFLLGFDQHSAQGTSLALLLPPLGVLAVIEYYRNGYVDIKAAAIMAVLFFVGALLGAKLANHIDDMLLRKIFAGFMFLAALRMFFT